jgi:hypothetical protein
MKKHVEWLFEQLPVLVDQGILPTELAASMRRHYDEELSHDHRNWALLSFAILGGVLIAAGIILVLAHNWEQLSRPMRAAISVMPLAAAQGLAAWVIRRRTGSRSWREGVAAFWVASIIAAIALISQTYNLHGSFAVFMLTCGLLALPIVYLLESSVAAASYWICVTSWIGGRETHGTMSLRSLAFYPLLGLAVPHLWLLIRRDRNRREAAALACILALVMTIGLAFCLDGPADPLLAYTGWFSALLLAGFVWLDDERIDIRGWPMFSLGGTGTLCIALYMTFDAPWYESSLATHAGTNSDLILKSMAFLWPVAALGLWAVCLSRRDLLASITGTIPLMGILNHYARAPLQHGLPAIRELAVGSLLADGYLLASGIAAVAVGVQRRRLGLVNVGTAVISVLMITRFFDSTMDLLTRGLLFVMVGVGFLTVNWMLARRMRGAR